MKLLAGVFMLLVAYTVHAQQTFSIGGGSQSNSVSLKKKVGVGQPVPDIRFGKVLNAAKSEISLQELKGKIVILEFWATWCGPCLPAMDHLAALKQKFPNDIEVIAISQETEERLNRFIKNKPSSIWQAIDPEYKLSQYFPHRFIPHTVIIDQEGKVAAITSPTGISEKIIEQLISRQKIQLPEKEDEGIDGFDFSKDYFPKNESTGYSFEVQPPIPGGFAMTRKVAAGPWKGRRLTMLNSPVAVIYRSIYNIGSIRMIYEGLDETEMRKGNQKETYCIDITVPAGKENELYSYAQNEIAKLDLPVKARLETRKMMVAILTCTDPKKLPVSNEEKTPVKSGPVFMNASNFKKKGISLDDFVKDYLESYGLLGMPVVNGTNIQGLFDFDVQLDMEDKSSLKNALDEMGLKIVKEEREIEVLVLYKS